MPPKIASLLCVCLIGFLLYIDHKKHRDVPLSIWVPTFWFLIVASRVPSFWYYMKAPIDVSTSTLEGSPFDRNIFLLLIIAGIYILDRYRQVEWNQLLRKNKVPLLFFVYLAFSCLWSDYSFVSFKRWIKEVGNVVMVLTVISSFNANQCICAIFRRCAYILVPISILWIKYYPSLGRSFSHTGDLSYVGVSLQKNGLGMLCLLFSLILSYLLLFDKNRKSKFSIETISQGFTLLLTFYLFKLANSSTALMCYFIGLFSMFAVGFVSIRRNIDKIGIISIASICTFISLQYFFNITEFIILSLGEDLTLTGRTDIWHEVLRIGTNPLIGSGYESYWLSDKVIELNDRLSFNINQSHNGYLETYLNLGGIGLFLLISLILASFRRIKNALSVDFEFGRLQLSIFIVALTYNITEAAFKGLSFIWLSFLLICAFAKNNGFKKKSS